MLPTSVTVPPLRTRVDGGGDGVVAAHGFEDDVGAVAAGLFQDFARQVGAGEIERLVHSERAGEIETRGVDVGDEYSRAPSGTGGLHCEQADHAAPMTRAVWPWMSPVTLDGVEGDRNGFDHGGLLEWHGFGQVVEDALGTTTYSANAPCWR